MDYSYLNQAGFDTSGCLQGPTPGMVDMTSLGGMPCTYGDLSSCSQMSQAAYRYTASMAASRSVGYSSGTPGHHTGVSSAGPCSGMSVRPHPQDVRAAMFPASMGLQGMFRLLVKLLIINGLLRLSLMTENIHYWFSLRMRNASYQTYTTTINNQKLVRSILNTNKHTNNITTHFYTTDKLGFQQIN